MGVMCMHDFGFRLRSICDRLRFCFAYLAVLVVIGCGNQQPVSTTPTTNANPGAVRHRESAVYPPANLIPPAGSCAPGAPYDAVVCHVNSSNPTATMAFSAVIGGTAGDTRQYCSEADWGASGENRPAGPGFFTVSPSVTNGPPENFCGRTDTVTLTAGPIGGPADFGAKFSVCEEAGVNCTNEEVPYQGTVYIVIDRTAPTPTPLPSPPPPPVPDQADITMMIGQSADFSLTDDATSSDGTLTWNVQPLNQATPVAQFSNPTTSQAPHADDLIVSSDATTKTGVYDIGLSVTSGVTGLQSAQSVVHLKVLLPVALSNDVSTFSVMDQASPEYVFAQAPLENPSVDETALSAYDTGNDNSYSVDATTFPYPAPANSYGTAFARHGRAALASKKRARPRSSVTGSPFDPIICYGTANVNAQTGQIVLANVTYTCDRGLLLGAVLGVDRTDVNDTSVTNTDLTPKVFCDELSGSTPHLST